MRHADVVVLYSEQVIQGQWLELVREGGAALRETLATVLACADIYNFMATVLMELAFVSQSQANRAKPRSHCKSGIGQEFFSRSCKLSIRVFAVWSIRVL